MCANDFIFGAEDKLKETLEKADKLFKPKLIGVVGTCTSMIIGEDLRKSVDSANIQATVLVVESHGGLNEGDNTEGAVNVLEAALKKNLILEKEADRQIKMLKLATKIEKTRGMVSQEYIKPSPGDNKEKVAKIIIKIITKLIFY
jgi:nitrogenase molybdenum-iron protein alpha/beta subunit